MVIELEELFLILQIIGLENAIPRIAIAFCIEEQHIMDRSPALR